MQIRLIDVKPSQRRSPGQRKILPSKRAAVGPARRIAWRQVLPQLRGPNPKQPVIRLSFG